MNVKIQILLSVGLLLIPVHTYANLELFMMSFDDPQDLNNRMKAESLGRSLLQLRQGTPLKLITTSQELGTEFARTSFNVPLSRALPGVTLEPFRPTARQPLSDRAPDKKVVLAIPSHGGREGVGDFRPYLAEGKTWWPTGTEDLSRNTVSGQMNMIQLAEQIFGTSDKQVICNKLKSRKIRNKPIFIGISSCFGGGVHFLTDIAMECQVTEAICAFAGSSPYRMGFGNAHDVVEQGPDGVFEKAKRLGQNLEVVTNDALRIGTEVDSYTSKDWVIYRWSQTFAAQQLIRKYLNSVSEIKIDQHLRNIYLDSDPQFGLHADAVSINESGLKALVDEMSVSRDSEVIKAIADLKEAPWEVEKKKLEGQLKGMEPLLEIESIRESGESKELYKNSLINFVNNSIASASLSLSKLSDQEVCKKVNAIDFTLPLDSWDPIQRAMYKSFQENLLEGQKYIKAKLKANEFEERVKRKSLIKLLFLKNMNSNNASNFKMLYEGAKKCLQSFP
jgi:hypothetical protein